MSPTPIVPKTLTREPSYGAVTTSSEDTRVARTEEEDAVLGEASEEQPLLAKTGPPLQKAKFKDIWLVCLGLWSAIFCSAIGQTLIANLQLEIATDFEAGHLASWLGSGYLLGVAALTPIYGRLSNIIGRRATIIMAMALFSIGTTLCAFSTSMGMMIAARCIAGAGGGGLFTVAAIIIADLVSLADRGLYQGLVNIVITGGTGVGSIIGGAIADEYGWRAAFYSQLPLHAVALGLILWKVKLHTPEQKEGESWKQKLGRIDWLGCLAVIMGVSSLMVALSLHTSFDKPISDPSVWGLLVFALICTIAFYFIEEHVAEPVVPMELLRQRTPAAIMIAMGFYMSTLLSRGYILPVYLKVVRGCSSALTGLLMLPAVATGAIFSLFAGWWMRHFQVYKSLALFGCLLPFLSDLAILKWSPNTNLHRLWIEMALAAAGNGIIVTTYQTGLIAAVSHEMMAIAIAAHFLFRSIGQVLGVSLSFATLQYTLERALRSRLGDNADELISRIIHTPSSTLPLLSPSDRLQATLAYLTSTHVVFVFVALSNTVIFFCGLIMKEYPLPGR